MAEFCKQCSIDMWGVDTKDFAGIITEAQFKQGFVARVLCEGCGKEIYVNHLGERIYVTLEETPE